MSIIYLVRHAQAEGNIYRRIHGWTDGRITPTGMEQIAALEKRFRSLDVDFVWSSDLTRAMTTAQAAARPHDLPILPEPGLREVHLGVYEDLPAAEMDFRFPRERGLMGGFSPQFAPSGGESLRQVARRMTETFFRVASACPDSSIALFSHSMAIRCLQSALRGVPPDQFQGGICPNTGVSCYEVRGSKLRTVYENDDSHLPSSLRQDCHKRKNVRFVPLDLAEDAPLYRAARSDAWLQAHPDLIDFDGPGFLSEARDQQLWDPRALQCALLDGEKVGILQLSTLHGVAEAVGHIPFLWVREDLRKQGVGSQLVGQAVSTYRAMGRKKLQLQCSPANHPAQRFYQHLGFERVRSVPGASSPLDLLELPL